jgi:glycosyltransferase involved in cell wall biosynthesis
LRILFIHEVNYSAKPIYEMHEFPEQLAALGHDVAFWHFPEGQSIFSNLANGWKREIRGRVNGETLLTLYSIPFLEGNLLGRLLTAGIAHIWSWKVFRDFRPDVVVSLSVPTQGWQALWVAKRMGIPFVFRALDVSHLIRKTAFNSLVKRAEKYVYRTCDLLSANNSAMLRYCLPDLDLARSKGVVHLPPLDLKMFALGDRVRGRAFLKLGVQVRVIMYMGSFFYFSGLGEVIIEFLKRRKNEKLVLVGGGEQEAELRKLTADLGAEDAVFFPGFVAFDSLPDVLRAADVAINPMEQSLVSDVALPNKVLQYLAAHVPTVSTPLQGLQATLGDLPDLSWAATPGEIVEQALKIIESSNRPLQESSSAHLLELFSNSTNSFEKSLSQLVEKV